jgi:hypothetical protein
LQVTDGDLLVRSCRTGQEILAHTGCACRFSAGDCVRIRFNGVMTMSIPPQITACKVWKIGTNNSARGGNPPRVFA